MHFLCTSDHDCSDLLVRNAVGRKVGNPSITVYIYAFLSHDSYHVREIKYWKFESNMDVHFCLTPLPPCPHVSASAWPPSPHCCRRLLWMTSYLLYVLEHRHKRTFILTFNSYTSTKHRQYTQRHALSFARVPFLSCLFLSLPTSFCLSVSLSLCLSFSHTLSHSHSPSVSSSHTSPLCRVSFSLSLPPSVSLSLLFTHTLSLSVCLFLFLSSLSTSLSLSLLLTQTQCRTPNSCDVLRMTLYHCCCISCLVERICCHCE